MFLDIGSRGVRRQEGASSVGCADGVEDGDHEVAGVECGGEGIGTAVVDELGGDGSDEAGTCECGEVKT